jgi:hypothetical protein
MNFDLGDRTRRRHAKEHIHFGFHGHLICKNRAIGQVIRRGIGAMLNNRPSSGKKGG